MYHATLGSTVIKRKKTVIHQPHQPVHLRLGSGFRERETKRESERKRERKSEKARVSNRKRDVH